MRWQLRLYRCLIIPLTRCNINISQLVFGICRYLSQVLGRRQLVSSIIIKTLQRTATDFPIALVHLSSSAKFIDENGNANHRAFASAGQGQRGAIQVRAFIGPTDWPMEKAAASITSATAATNATPSRCATGKCHKSEWLAPIARNTSATEIAISVFFSLSLFLLFCYRYF